MRRQLYYLYKVILSDFLFSMLFILLFSLLNFNVEVFNSFYVLLFGATFAILDYFFVFANDFIQSRIIKRMSYKQIIVDDKNEFLKTILLFKLVSFGLMILALFITSKLFFKFIIIKNFFIILLLVVIISFLRIVLNKIVKFDTILFSTKQKDIQKKLDKLLEELNKRENEDEDSQINHETLHEEIQKIINDLEKDDEE